MHFVTGGAFNGKSAWVKQQYSINAEWLTADNLFEPGSQSNMENNTVVIEGVEQLVRQEIDSRFSADILLNKVMMKIEPWLAWERQEPSRNLVLIGTDITKGIVPIEKADRLQRDVTGWVYQRLVTQAERVDIIWYGISKTIKMKERL